MNIEMMDPEIRKQLLARYDHVGQVSEGLVCICDDNGWFHVQFNGTSAYKQRYDHVGPFVDGLAWVRQVGKRFQIRPDGTKVD